MRVVGPQLAGVLDEHEPLVGIDQGQQGGEQGGLAGAGAAADQERQPGRDDRASRMRAASARQRAERDQLVEA